MIRKNLAYIVIFGTLIQLIYFLGIDNPAYLYIGTVLLIFSAIFLKPLESFCVFSFLLSNQRIIVIEKGGASLLNIVIVILLVRLITLNRVKSEHLHPGFYFLMVFLGIVLIFFNGKTSVLKSTIKFIVTITLFISFVIYLYIKGYVKEIKLFYSYIIGTIFTGLISIVFEGLDFGEERFSGGEYNNSNILGTSFSFI